ncbi:hypothetical protein ElyMa_001557400 [Elysia marginata]|uniref:Uncharacterized protein n=1 Tax=Elysia marginata TaxID=1093978 RepID=A0AAV4JAW6_9GAST|nr:hypothetical protein ElyMa_001557400 [Elysia marginata]
MRSSFFQILRQMKNADVRIELILKTDATSFEETASSSSPPPLRCLSGDVVMWPPQCVSNLTPPSHSDFFLYWFLPRPPQNLLIP